MKFVEITHSEVIAALDCFNKAMTFETTSGDIMTEDTKIYAAMLAALGVAHQYYFDQLNGVVTESKLNNELEEIDFVLHGQIITPRYTAKVINGVVTELKLHSTNLIADKDTT